MPLRSLFFFVFLVFISSKQGYAAETDTLNKEKKLLPTTAQFQFAGFIGMLSAGLGYHYWNRNLCTSLFYGYVPQAYALRPIHTIALKQTFSIYNINRVFSYGLSFQPIFYGGLTVNCEVSKHSFITLPDYYPKGYYNTQALHATVFSGLRFNIPLDKGPVKKAIEPYAEIGTLDTYLWYHISGEINDTDDIFRIALGINYFFR